MDWNWNNNFAYAVGLITADGCLSKDGRHVDVTSKDKEQITNFKHCLNLKNKIGRKSRDREKIKKYYHVQFGDVKLYRFLENIGLHSRKSLTIESVNIPDKFFADFLRGYFDGDGSFVTFKHPESKHIQIRLKFACASPIFIRWLHKRITKQLENKKVIVRGFISKGKRAECLEFGKADSIKVLNYMYYSPNVTRLSRKFNKAKPYFMRT
ncbi:LAGLIDADG family homing endonuclease [Patescibacteria group bacterium]|nr:LAGLIDADG family homing endonuclease [Patescibacteria group bacterium]